MIPENRNSVVHAFDELAAEYDAWYDGDGNLIFRIEAQAFGMLLPDMPEPWLEIGVGSGRFAQALGIETGIDPSPNLIEIARKRGIKAFDGYGENSPFEEKSFGTVFLIVTLCFLSSPLAVLKEAGRILAPGGKIALGLVLKDSPWGKYYQQKKAEGHRFYRHATFYSVEEVAGLLEQAGFTTETTISTLFQAPGNVKQAEQPRKGYHPEAGFTIIAAKKKTEVKKQDTHQE